MATKKSAKRPPDRKTEVLSIRIDPRVKYGLELLSRLQRRSTTGVVEWAIQSAFQSEIFEPANEYRGETRLEEVMDELWHINDIERIVALALRKEQLLTYEESRIWKVLSSTPAFWTKKQHRDFDSFLWAEVLSHWPTVERLVSEAVEKPIVRGYTDEELFNLGLDLTTMDIPF